MSLRWLRPDVSSQFQSRSSHLDLASGAVEEGARVSKVQSGEIKRIKGAINEQTAHANVFNSQHNLWYVDGEHPEIHTTYFDVDDDHWVKVDIWECAQAGLIASDLILAVQEKYGGFIPSRMVNELGPLIAANDDLLTLLECKED
jgi:hypothetical protein